MHSTRVQERTVTVSCNMLWLHIFIQIYVAHGIDFTDMKTLKFGFQIYISLLVCLQYKIIEMHL